jgi:protein-tyrosine-phosphatase
MDYAIETMAVDGFDLTPHRSRKVSPDLIRPADLVVTMAHQHVVDLALLAPDSWRKVFQLRDLVRRGDATTGRAPEQPLHAWLATVGAGRTRSGLVSGSLTDDIADPVGEGRGAYDQAKRTIDQLTTRLAALLG